MSTESASPPNPPTYHDGRHYQTSASFRQAQAAHRATSSRRIIPISDLHPAPERRRDRQLRLTATPSGGNCGFQAIAWALLHLGIGGAQMCSTRVRDLLSQHVASSEPFYVRRLVETRVVGEESEARESVKRFVVEVRKQGIRGHWLGEMWGALEIVAVARAVGVCVELFAFDVQTQRVRVYQRVEEGKKIVALLFTGEAKAGHFDLLLPVRRWWQRR